MTLPPAEGSAPQRVAPLAGLFLHYNRGVATPGEFWGSPGV